MHKKTTHEPGAKVMSAEDVKNDAQEIAFLLRQNSDKAEPVVSMQIPLSYFISALDNLDRNELIILRDSVEERLAI